MQVDQDEGEDHVTGMQVMQRQHEQLHRRLRGLAEQLETADEKGLEGIPDQIEGLVDNIRVHFEAEEEVMFFHGYPQAETHRAAHQHFLRAVDDLLKRREAGDPTGLKDVVALLEGWVTAHMAEQDQMFREFQEALGADGGS